MMKTQNKLMLSTALVLTIANAQTTLLAFEADVDHDWSSQTTRLTTVAFVEDLEGLKQMLNESSVVTLPETSKRSNPEAEKIIISAETLTNSFTNEELSKQSIQSKQNEELEAEKDSSPVIAKVAEDEAVQKTVSITSISPLITENSDGTVSINETFQAEQDLLLEMNDLSYLIVKGDKSQIERMQKLQDEGFVIKSFSGLEGRRNTFGDLSGLIFVQQKTGKVYVIVHGTATVDGVEINGVDHGKMAGWGTNFDGTRQKAFKLQSEYGKDLFEQVLQDMKDNRIHMKPAAYKALKKELTQKLYNENTGYKDVCEMNALFQAAIDNEEISLNSGRLIVNAFITKLRVMDHVEEVGVNLPGEIHNGFLKKYVSFREDLLYALRSVSDEMQIEELIVSGHSMGGGLAPLVLYDTKVNFGKDIFGEKNQKGVAKGYFLSAARVGDKTFAKAIDEGVGKENMIRHNVYGDPVPIAAGDKFMKELLEKVPAIGELLGQTAGYADFGYLVKDDANEAWERAKTCYKDNADFSEYVDHADELVDALSTVASWTGHKDQIPSYVAKKQKNITWYGNPIQTIQRTTRVYRLAKLIKATYDGNEQAQEQLTNTLMVRYAHLHLGYSRNKQTGAVFDPRVVGRDLNKMANDGKVHEEQRLKGKGK